MKSGKKNKKIHAFSKETDLIRVCRLLNKRGAKYLIIGGFALSLHGFIRATKDIDLLIPQDVTNTQTILEALKEGLVFGIAAEMDAEEVTHKPITIIGDTPRVDLLTVASRVKYQEAKGGALETRVDGVRIPYVDLKTLVKTKQTGRLQDKADIERLKKILKKI